MLSCLRTRALLPRLIERETGPLETLEARRHLDQCSRCRTRFDALVEDLRLPLASAGAVPAIESGPVGSGPELPDVAASVMDRLRALRRQSLAQGLPLPGGARWSSLALFLGAGLGAACLPGAPLSRALGRPFAILQGWIAGEWTQHVEEMATAAVPLAARAANGTLRLELPLGAPPELVTVLQILATALGIVFTIAIPAGALAAWLVRASRRP